MKIENTKFITEEVDYDIANDYLNLGWTLINHYVIDVGETDCPNQKIRFVLAWQNQEVEPKHPPFSFHEQKSKMIESMVQDMIDEDKR